MTQKVKKSRASPLTVRSLAALLLLMLGTLGAGCSGTNTDPPGASGSAGCSGSSCGGASGRFTACDSNSQCDEAHGFSCVDGECSYACQSHADCIAVGHCDARLVDGERKNFCVRDRAPPEPGKLYSSCPQGDECADAPLCIGAGPGDLDAYCTIDCSVDDDCAAGYYCGTMSRNPCEAACGLKGVPTDARCVHADQIGTDRPFHCSELGVERQVCRQREFCSTCQNDADCLALPNQVCAKDESGEKICTRLCNSDTRSCPWGNAASCGVFDDELGVPTCSHRFGKCHGSGETCEPCRGNEDCPGGACATSQFTGERWCVNFDTHCSCKSVDASGACSDGGCPPSPSGLPIQCIGAMDSSLFNICYAANSGTQTLLGSSPQTGCWDAR